MENKAKSEIDQCVKEEQQLKTSIATLKEEHRELNNELEMKGNAENLRSEEEEEKDEEKEKMVGSPADSLKADRDRDEAKSLTESQVQQWRNELDDVLPQLSSEITALLDKKIKQAFEQGVTRALKEANSICALADRDRDDAKSLTESPVQQLRVELEDVLQQLFSEITKTFDGSIKPTFEEGETSASQEANSTCEKWEAPLKKGGQHWKTYLAAVKKNGVSKTDDCDLNMNEELSSPFYESINPVLDDYFKKTLLSNVEDLKRRVREKLEKVLKLREEPQLRKSVESKLTEMVNYLEKLITKKKQATSCSITSAVQESLKETYASCPKKDCTGIYDMMKKRMKESIEQKRTTMFKEAGDKLMAELEGFQYEIVAYLRCVCQNVLEDVRSAFEHL